MVQAVLGDPAVLADPVNLAAQEAQREGRNSLADFLEQEDKADAGRRLEEGSDVSRSLELGKGDASFAHRLRYTVELLHRLASEVLDESGMAEQGLLVDLGGRHCEPVAGLDRSHSSRFLVLR